MCAFFWTCRLSSVGAESEWLRQGPEINPVLLRMPRGRRAEVSNDCCVLCSLPGGIKVRKEVDCCLVSLLVL